MFPEGEKVSQRTQGIFEGLGLGLQQDASSCPPSHARSPSPGTGQLELQGPVVDSRELSDTSPFLQMLCPSG